jgi:hypothetical protein
MKQLKLVRLRKTKDSGRDDGEDKRAGMFFLTLTLTLTSTCFIFYLL